MRSKVVVVATVVLAIVATVGVTVASASVSSQLAARQQDPDRAARTSASVSSRLAARQRGRDRAAPTIAVGEGPYEVAIDQATHTAYVGDGNNMMSVVNIATCNAKVTSGCGQTPPTVTVGAGPVDAAVDQATDTIYVVALGSDTISVINGATCNATVTTGCSQTPPTVTVGEGPDGIAVDQATDTIYVANAGPGDNNTGHTVSVINGATCNGQVTSGCGQTPATVPVGFGPVVPAVDEATNTIYVPNSNPNGRGSVSVINGATCDGTVRTGCGRTPPTVSVGPNSYAVAVDQATDTVYEPAGGPSLGRVYVINGATCNSTVTSGCGQTPATVTVGSGDCCVVVDPVTESVFVVNMEDSTVSVIDGRICNALHAAGCAQHPPVVATGFEPGYLDVDLATDTLYVANQYENNVSVLNAAACTLTHQSGCRRAVPTTTVVTAPAGIAVNQVTGTIYVGSQTQDDLSVINASTCNAVDRSGCRRHWPTADSGVVTQAVAVDPRTDTVYTANSNFENGVYGTTVSVLDGATCNAHVTRGCRRAPATVHVGNGPDALAVNDATDTIYVANAQTDTVSVIDGATCNATIRSGCGRSPRLVKVGKSPQGVAIDQATDTIYVTNNGPNTVSVINGATCNSVRHSGCRQTPPTIKVGHGPVGLAVDTATDTVYAENVVDNTVSVIDGATCNASKHSGCDQKPPTMTTGTLPFEGVAVDQATDTVFLGSIADSDIDVYNGRTCNATVRSGCHQQPRTVNTGGWPGNVAVDSATGTIYAPDNVDGQMSFFAFVRPARPTHVTAVAHAGAVRVRWRAPAAGGLPVRYQVIPSPACPACRGLHPEHTTSTTVTGLKTGRTYTFTVRAADAAGTGSRSLPSHPVTP